MKLKTFAAVAILLLPSLAFAAGGGAGGGAGGAGGGAAGASGSGSGGANGAASAGNSANGGGNNASGATSGTAGSNAANGANNANGTSGNSGAAAIRTRPERTRWGTQIRCCGRTGSRKNPHKQSAAFASILGTPRGKRGVFLRSKPERAFAAQRASALVRSCSGQSVAHSGGIVIASQRASKDARPSGQATATRSKGTQGVLRSLDRRVGLRPPRDNDSTPGRRTRYACNPIFPR